MGNVRLALRLIIPGFILGVIFACLASGLVAPGVFEGPDRAYFGFASCIGFGLGALGFLLLIMAKK